jgi:hypothetical protein
MRELTLMEVDAISGGRTEMFLRRVNEQCEEFESCPSDPSDSVPCFRFWRCDV